MALQKEEHSTIRLAEPFRAVGQALRSNKVIRQGTRTLQHGTRFITNAGKVVGSVVVGAADAVHLTTAINLTTHSVAVFGRKAGITGGVQMLRRQFFRDYVGMDIPELDAEEDLADADDGIILNDDELEVEERFFEKGFDAVGWEVNFLVHLGEDEDLEVIRGHLEVHELKRRRQHDLVAMTLKKRVLLRHGEFVDAINEVMKVLHNLHATAEACAVARMRLKEAKHTCAVRGLRIPMLDRRKRNIHSVAALADAMKQFIGRYNSVTRHLDNYEYAEAVQIMQETTAEHLPPKLFELKAMESVIQKWKELHSPDTLMRYVQRYIDTCLVNFNKNKYIDVLEGVRQSHNFQLGELTRKRIGEKLQERIASIIKTTMAKVSSIKDADLPVEKIASNIDPAAISLCMSSICIQLIDCLRLVNCLVNAHSKAIEIQREREASGLAYVEDADSQSSSLNFHSKCILDIRLALRDADLPQQLGYVLTYAPLQSVDKSSRFHVAQLARLLIEALTPLLAGLPEKKQIYHQRRDFAAQPTSSHQEDFYISHDTLMGAINAAALGVYKRIEFVTQSAELLQSMLQDTWVCDPAEKAVILRSSIVQPMSTKLFEEEAEKMRSYVETDTLDSVENPFFYYQQAVNTAAFFGDINGPALSPRGSGPRNQVYFYLAQFQETPYCDPHRMTFTFSSVRFHAFMTSMLFDVIVRIPSIADGILGLFDTLIGSYMFMACNMLVRKHKEQQLVDDTRFSQNARAVFRSILKPDGGENIFASFTSDKKFPPLIFSETRWLNGFADEKKLFSLEDRLTVFEVMPSVISLYETFLSSVGPLMSKEALSRHQDRAVQLRLTANELFEVGCHMICTAIIQPTLTNLLTNLNGARFDHTGSSFIRKFIDSFKRDDFQRLTKSLSRSPTRYSQDVFWARLYFTVLDTMTKALAPNRSKLAEKNFINCASDVSQLQEQLKSIIPCRDIIVFDNYVLQFLNTYFTDPEEGWRWVSENHTYYHAEDLCRWFGGSSADSQGYLQMEKRLIDELGRRKTEDAQLKLYRQIEIQSRPNTR